MKKIIIISLWLLGSNTLLCAQEDQPWQWDRDAIAKLLLEPVNPEDGKLPNINMPDANDDTPLLYAASTIHILVPPLIYGGADVNRKNKAGLTPLLSIAHSAKNEDRITLSAIETLLRNKARADIKYEGKTALHMFTELGQISAIKLILSCMPAVINVPDSDGNTVLHYAAKKGSIALIDTFLQFKKYLTIDVHNGLGHTPLHYTILHARGSVIDVVKKLLTAGANINTQNFEGETPYFTVCRGLNPEVELYLLSLQSGQLNTLYQNSHNHKFLSLFKLLLANGTDRTIKNNYGALPESVVNAEKLEKLKAAEAQRSSAASNAPITPVLSDYASIGLQHLMAQAVGHDAYHRSALRQAVVQSGNASLAVGQVSGFQLTVAQRVAVSTVLHPTLANQASSSQPVRVQSAVVSPSTPTDADSLAKRARPLE